MAEAANAEQKVETPNLQTDGFVGRFFHILGEDGETKYRGHVETRIDHKHYLVTFYQWFMELPACQAVVTIDGMANGLYRGNGSQDIGCRLELDGMPEAR